MDPPLVQLFLDNDYFDICEGVGRGEKGQNVVHVQVCSIHFKGMSIDRETSAQLSVECNFPAIINEKSPPFSEKKFPFFFVFTETRNNFHVLLGNFGFSVSCP